MHPSSLANFLDGIPPTYLVLLVGGFALIFAIRRWRSNTIRRNAANDRAVFIPTPSDSDDAPDPDPPASPTPYQRQHQNPLSVREVSTELAALLADLEETSRRVAAQIENRRTGLEILLKEADEKIRRLESLAKSTASPPESRPAPVALSPDAAQLIARLRQERSTLNPPPTEDPAYRPIYQLADQGRSPREIAQQLSRNPGEIELILALRPKQRT